jgi:predicted nucleotide-binding protein
MAEGIKRNFPMHTLSRALVVAQAIQDEMAGKPFKRLLLSEALGIKPGSTNLRDMLSSSFKYGLTEGTEKAVDITLTTTGSEATQQRDPGRKLAALRKAALTPQVFRDVYNDYDNRKIPGLEMMKKILTSEYAVPADYAEECATIILENGRFVGIIRDISGSPHVMLESQISMGAAARAESTNGDEPAGLTEITSGGASTAVDKAEINAPNGGTPPMSSAIFLGHGKNRAPVRKLEEILRAFNIPTKIVIDEANMARPIPQKVREVMMQCSSAILVFTKDQEFHDAEGNSLWRPSENVVYELGAASFAYENRVIIFKEEGLNFPTNFQSVGYIEFKVDSIEAKTTELLKELISFGLVKLMAA